jgi:hypothetical protein
VNSLVARRDVRELQDYERHHCMEHGIRCSVSRKGGGGR